MTNDTQQPIEESTQRDGLAAMAILAITVVLIIGVIIALI